MKWGAETHLFETDLLSSMFAFYSFSAKWIVSIADPESKGLPLPKIPCKEFAIIPEFFFESITDFYLSISRFYPGRFDGESLRDVFDMMYTFMNHGEYILNPYVRAKYPELLSTLIPFGDANKDPVNYIRPDLLEGCIGNNPTSDRWLIPGIMKLYVEIEKTGGSNAFYEKFNPRYFCALFIKYIWKYKNLRNSFIAEAKTADTLRFFNMLLNDAIYLLDESLKILTKIHKYETDRQDATVWNSLSTQARQERDNEFYGSERQVQSFMLLANETVHMLSYLSADAPQPFLRGEMVDRVASMLNYFCRNWLVQLVQISKLHKPIVIILMPNTY